MNKRSLILFVSPSIGVLIAASIVPFVSNGNAWSLREAVNSAAAWVEDSTKDKPSEEVKPSDFMKEGSQAESRPINERKFTADPRADRLSKLAYPQTLNAIRNMIGYEDYTRSGNPEYMSGYGSIQLQREGDRITGYEVRQ